MRDIMDLNLDELEGALKKWGAPSYSARQILSWIYRRNVKDFSKMTDVPLAVRDRLIENFSVSKIQPVAARRSRDGTEKFLFQLRDNDLIEAVIIPEEKRVTGCISSQAGCKFSCAFCASGIGGFKRNLSCGEILDEIFNLMHNAPGRKLTHIVCMGTGEPLDNYDAVMKAIRIANAEYGFGIAARRITVSTCGIIPGIKKLSREGLQIELSVSLHAADNATRSLLVPVNRKYPLPELLNACREYIRKTNRQITFEYVLMKDRNSDLQSARKLSTIVKSLGLCKVNLIPANRIEEYRIQPPEERDIVTFKNYLLAAGVRVTLRKPRGQDIEAACGQLRLRYEER